MIGFIAHVDTSPDMSGKEVKPRVIDEYDGGDIALNGQLTMRVADFPELTFFKGHTLIHTDGTTLLGADDKAGVAEIMTAAEYLHGAPRGETRQDTHRLHARRGGGPRGRFLRREGLRRRFRLHGRRRHGGRTGIRELQRRERESRDSGPQRPPGYAKNKMVNAIDVACELQGLLPASQRPQYTEGYEGFYHCVGLNGTVEKASVSYIIRDHDAEKFEQKKVFMWAAVDLLKKKYGDQVRDPDAQRSVLQHAQDGRAAPAGDRQGSESDGDGRREPVVRPIRGGTDGARLSFMGLPCPNLFTGGMNFHGKFEYCSLTTMRKAQQVILNLAVLWSE